MEVVARAEPVGDLEPRARRSRRPGQGGHVLLDSQVVAQVLVPVADERVRPAARGAVQVAQQVHTAADEVAGGVDGGAPRGRTREGDELGVRGAGRGVEERTGDDLRPVARRRKLVPALTEEEEVPFHPPRLRVVEPRAGGAAQAVAEVVVPPPPSEQDCAGGVRGSGDDQWWERVAGRDPEQPLGRSPGPPRCVAACLRRKDGRAVFRDGRPSVEGRRRAGDWGLGSKRTCGAENGDQAEMEASLHGTLDSGRPSRIGNRPHAHFISQIGISIG